MNVPPMIADVAMTFGLFTILAVVGLPSQIAVRRLAGLGWVSPGLSWLFGFFWLSVASWYAFAAGIKLGDAYRAVLLVSACIIGAGLTLARLRRSPTRPGTAGPSLGELSADLAGFGAGAMSYVGMAASRLTPRDLPWPTVHNADVFVYVKFASFLSLFPGGRPTVGTTDLRNAVGTDVFACFNLLSFARFVFRSEVSHVVLPVMALGVGLVAMAVARCCRVVFRLGPLLSTLLALVTVTGVLFQYIALNYFLSQVTFVAILLTAVLSTFEGQDGRWRPLVGLGCVAVVSSACVLLGYNVWSIQYVALLAVAAAATRASPPRLSAAGRAVRAVSAVAVVVAASLAGMALASPWRLARVAAQLATVSVPNIAGWPLPFVDLDLLLGLPVDWHIDGSGDRLVHGSVLAFLTLLVAVGLSAAKLDKARDGAARLIALGAFYVGVLAYAVVWLKFGETYQQWKFASTIPLGFGFTVLATIIGLARRDTSRSARVAVGAAAAAFLVVCVGLNVSLTRDKWLATISHLPASFEDLAVLDRSSDQTPVYVDIADFQTRMAALAFINLKPVTFADGSQFGPGSPPPADDPYFEIVEACDAAGRSPPSYTAVLVKPGAYPVVPLDQPVLFSHDTSACLSMSGFAPPEPWGRRSVGHHAAFHMRCGCDLGSDDVSLVLDAASPLLPDLPGSQQAVVRINGSSPRTFDLDPVRFSDIVVPVPPPPGGGESIDVEIDLPDAAARPDAAGSPDAPVYALSVKSLTLRAQPR